MNLLNSKKAVLGDSIAVVITLFLFVFSIIVDLLILTTFTDQINLSVYASPAITSVGNSFKRVLMLFDYITVFLFAIMIIGVAKLSRKVASAPVFFIIVILGSSIVGFTSYYFNFIFAQMISDPLFNVVTAFFPRSILIATNLHWVALAIMVVGSIALYGKKEKGQFVP